MIEAQGDVVTKLDRADEEALRALNLTIGEDGKLDLLEEDGTATSSVGGQMKESAPLVEAPPNQPCPALDSPRSAEADPGAPLGSSTDEDLEVDPLVVQLPPDWQTGFVQAGGARPVLTIDSQFGPLHVPVPKVASGGSKLEILGMVEIALGAGHPHWLQSAGAGQWQKSDSWNVGDVVAVNMPEGAVARITIPDSAMLDATLRVAYPVVILPCQD